MISKYLEMAHDPNPNKYPAELIRRLEKGRLTQPKDIYPNFQLIKQLGWGYEGFIYLVRDQSNDHKYVLKIFHEPFNHEEGIWNGLDCYVDKVPENPYGLYKVKAYRVNKQIICIQYPYEKLYRVTRHVLNLSNQFRRSLVGQFCMMQSYLLSNFGIGIIDPGPRNFLFDRSGQFHFVDFGLGIRTTSDPISQECGLFGYSLANILLGVYNISLRQVREASTGYNYSKPCRYLLCEELKNLASSHPWLRSIHDQVRCLDGFVYLDPNFYRNLGETLPQRIQFPLVFCAASEFNMTVRKIKNWQRDSAWGGQ